MIRTKLIQPFAYVVCAAILLFAASRQAVQRQFAAPQQSPRFPGENRGALQQQRANEPPSENEWQQISEWMEIHCPNRMNFYLHRLENRPIEKAAVQKRIVELYRQLNGIRNDPLLKQALVNQAEAADKVFGAALNFREANQQHDARGAQVAQQSLQAATEQLVDAEITVKQARVQRLQSEVEDMIKRKQQLVNQRFHQQLNLARNPLPAGKATGDADVAPPPSDADKH
jgi:hypothetical protein